MACKGSGVQIPSAPPPSSRGNNRRTYPSRPQVPQQNPKVTRRNAPTWGFEFRGRPRAGNRQIRFEVLAKRSWPGGHAGPTTPFGPQNALRHWRSGDAVAAA
jgi:hypothetical protein